MGTKVCVLLALYLNVVVSKVLKYCYDQNAHEIFNGRLSECVGGYFKPKEELNYLRTSFISEFQRAHELFAYEHFVHNAHSNPNYVSDCSQADLEYVPLLPLVHRSGWNSDTECTAGGVNCGREIKHCSMRSLVSNVVDYWHLVQQRGNVTHPRKFVVTSAFNFRSVLGFGMPTQRRSGEVWKTISDFTEATMLASYERIVQCPDLLRKQFKHIVELPYIPLVADSSSKRVTEFFFSGRLRLWGPERVCGVRAVLAATLPRRSDSLVYNVTYSSPGEAKMELVHGMAQSEFCIIAKGNSYSSASFYSAVANGCIPVVISDWFYFAFPMKIDYGKFVVRLSEESFLMNPTAALDAVLAKYDAAKRHEMRKTMVEVAGMLSWGTPGSTRAAHVFDNLMMEEMLSVDVNPDGYIGYSGCTKWDPQQCPSKVYTPPLQLQPAPEDTRSHLCKHSPRLIGRYKLVLFMQCARILWPIKAGNLRPHDTVPDGLGAQEKAFLWNFHNLSGTGSTQWRQSWSTYPFVDEETAKKIHQTKVYPGRFQPPHPDIE